MFQEAYSKLTSRSKACKVRKNRPDSGIPYLWILILTDTWTSKGLSKTTFPGKEKNIGLEKLVGFHFNDSKTALNSNRDRHADIGTGELGAETFKNILNHKKLKDLFAILETPEDTAPWKEQIKLLKSVRK